MEFTIDEFPGRAFRKNGKDYLYFGGTAYLGLQTYSPFQEIFINNIKKYGTTYSASRNSNVKMAIYDRLEHTLQEYTGTEACITLSSGYMASQLVSNYMLEQSIAFFYAPHTHPALHHSKTHNYVDYHSFISAVNQQLHKHPQEEIAIFCDSIDFYGNNYPDFFWLNNISKKENIILIVDDAHGIGIIGEHGEGIHPFLKTFDVKEVVICGSLSKGFAIQGGAIWGSKALIDTLAATPFFGGASPLTPAMAATFLESMAIYKKRLLTLRNNIALFKSNVAENLFVGNMAHFPAFTFTDEFLLKKLEANHIVVTSFSYPFKNSPLTNRIVISAHHTTDDILQLCNTIS